MAKYSYITDKTNNDRKIQVESAVRDGEGKNIVNNYAKQTGNYQTMSVGEAQSIASDRVIDDIDDACPPITFGTTGGGAEISDGFAKFKAIYGNSVVWNNGAKEINATNFNSSNGTQTFSNGKCTVVMDSSSISNTHLDSRYPYQLFAGHKYLAYYDITCSKSGVAKIQISSYALTSSIMFDANTKTRIGGIVTCDTTTASNGTIYLFPARIDNGAVGDTIVYENFTLVDLTLMFGAGNEPTSITDTKIIWLKQQLELHPEFNEGEIIDSQVSALDSVQRNQWDEEWEHGWWLNGIFVQDNSHIATKNMIRVDPNTALVNCSPYILCIQAYDIDGNYLGETQDMHTFKDKNGNYISNPTGGMVFVTPDNCAYITFWKTATTYNNDICIYLEWDTPNLPYVAYSKQVVPLPNVALRSAGSVKDELDNDGTLIRRVGTVDLGTLDWNYGSGGATRFSSQMLSGVKPSTTNLTCKLTTGTTTQVYTGDAQLGIHNTGEIWCLGTLIEGTSPAQFKQAMSGVILNYELATPTEEQTKNTFTELVKVNNYGTLLFTPTDNTKPQVLQPYYIEYTVNLVEFLDTAYVHTGGDGNAIALKTDLASDKSELSTVDSQLKEALGGTLRQLLATSQSVDFDNTSFIDLGNLNWQVSGSSFISTQQFGRKTGSACKGLSTKYKVYSTYSGYAGASGNRIGLSEDGTLYLYDSSLVGYTAEQVKTAMKGVLLAYEKA